MSLPEYKPSRQTFTEGGSITQEPLRQSMIRSNKVKAFLDRASQIAEGQATEFATEKAIQDAIIEPVTQEQVKVAQETGGNIIDKYTTGGSTYNDTIKKVIGQQTAGELDLILQEHNANVLDRVALGEITNTADLLTELQSPIKDQVNVLADIDPETARQYGASSTMSSRNAFLKGDAIFKQQQEDKHYANALKTIENQAIKMTDYMEQNPNASAAMKEEHKKALIAQAVDYSLSMSRRQTELISKLEDQLDDQEDVFVAKSLAKEYSGKTIKEALADIETNESANAEHFKAKSAVDETKLKNLLKGFLSDENSDLSAKKIIARNSLTVIDQALAMGQPAPQDALDIVKNYSYGDEGILNSLNQALYLQKKLVEYNSLSTMDLKDAQMELNNKKNKTSMDIRELDSLNKYIAGREAGVKKDPVEHVITREQEAVRLDFTDPRQFKTDFINRVQVINSKGVSKYGVKANEFFTKTEVAQFNQAFLAMDKSQRTQLIASIAEATGDEAYKAFNQITGDNRDVGHFAQLLIHGMDPVNAEIYQDGLNAKMQQGSDYEVYVENPSSVFAEEFGAAYDNHPGMADNIMAGAQNIYIGLLKKEGKPLEDYRKGNADKNFKSDLYRKALEIASGAVDIGGEMHGGVVEYNGRKISLPSSVKRDTFVGKMQNATYDDIVRSMTIKTDQGNYIPAFTVLDGKYYLNEVDPTTGRERVTDQVVDQPLLEPAQEGITQAEYSINRIKDSELEMESDKHAYITIDGEVFAVDSAPNLRVLLNIETIDRLSSEPLATFVLGKTTAPAGTVLNPEEVERNRRKEEQRRKQAQ